MTEARGPARGGNARKVRWSREHVRALAWVAGSATFFTGVAVLGAAPRLTANASNTVKSSKSTSKAAAHKKYTFIVVAPTAPVIPSYRGYSGGGGAPVYSSGGYTSGGGGTSSGGGGSSSGGGGSSTGGPPPPPPPPSPVCHTSQSGVTTCH